MIDDLLRPTGPGPRPPADGFVHALRDARRRRWRTLRNNVACATAAAAAVMAAVVPRLAMHSFAGLEPTSPVIMTNDAPRPTVVGAKSPSPTATPAPEPRDPALAGGYEGAGIGGPAGYAPAGYVPAGPAGRPAGTRSEPTAEPVAPQQDHGVDEQPPSEPDPTPEPTEDPPASPTPPPPPPSPDPEPVDLTFEDQSATTTCNGSVWCLSAQVTGTYTLRLRACRAASDTSGALHFGTENEAEFRIVRNGTEVWRWSTDQPDDDFVHDVYVDRWQCAVWSTTWWGNDQSGAQVAAGSYRLDAMSRSTSLAAKWWSATFTVT